MKNINCYQFTITGHVKLQAPVIARYYKLTCKNGQYKILTFLQKRKKGEKKRNKFSPKSDMPCFVISQL